MEWWVWALLFGVPLLIAFVLKFGVNPYAQSHIVSAFSILSFCAFVFALVAAAGFQFLGAWTPYLALGILGVMFLIAEIMFLLYFFWPYYWGARFNRARGFLKANLLKGWGGATFADFANGLGVLVPVGVYTVYTNNRGSLWWAGQLAALVAVMSAAAWVQRYILEGPAKKEENVRYADWSGANRSLWDYIKTTFVNLLGSLAALLGALLMLLPTEDNISGLKAGVAGENWIIVYVIWMVVFFIWAVWAIFPFFKRPYEFWPRMPGVFNTWKNRGQLGAYLIPVSILAGIAFVSGILLAVSTGGILAAGGDSSPAADVFGSILGIAAAALVVISVVWNWIFNGYSDDGALKIILISKDVLIFVSGLVIFAGQIVSASGNEAALEVGESWFAIVYLLFLALMLFAYFAGLLVGGYNWSKKPGYNTFIKFWPWVQSLFA